MTNSSCFVSCSDQQRGDPRSIDAVDLGQLFQPCFCGQGPCATQHVVRMVSDDPRPELSPNLGLANPFDDFDSRLAQNCNSLAIDARVRIAHADHYARHTARGDRARAGGGAPVKRARLERRVQSCSSDRVAARLGVASRGNFRVVLARALGMPSSDQASRRTHDHATDPRVVARRTSGERGLFDSKLKPAMVLGLHPVQRNSARGSAPFGSSHRTSRRALQAQNIGPFGRRSRKKLPRFRGQLAGPVKAPTMLAESMKRLFFPVVPAIFVLLGSTSARAQTDLERATARDAANSGRAAFEAGQYEKAIDQFSRAEQLVHAPPHLLYLARAQAKLGKLVAAHETYLKITRETLKANAPKAFSDAQSFAEQELPGVDARLPYVTVTLQGAAADGVNVDMDGTLLPPAMIGIPLPTDPGRHVFKATGAASGDPVTVTVAEAAKQTVVLKVRPVAAATPVAAPGSANAADTAAAPPPDVRESRGSGLRVASYVSFGLGAVGLGVGTYFLLKSKSTDEDAGKLFDQCVAIDIAGNCGPTREAYDAKDSDARSQRSIGVASMIAGGVGVAAGVTFLILDLSQPGKSAQRSTPHVTPVFGFNTVGLVGAF